MIYSGSGLRNISELAPNENEDQTKRNDLILKMKHKQEEERKARDNLDKDFGKHIIMET